MEEEQVLPPTAGISPSCFGIALVITVLSFALGLALGFFARPMAPGDKVEVVEVLVTATPDPQAIAQAPPAESANGNNSAPAAESARPPAEEKAASGNSAPPSIMDMVLADTRHFQGEADAPVTIIEFSDFK